MVKKRTLSLVSGALVFALVSLACGLSVPSGVPSEDAVATKVAETLNAMPQPTLEPTTLPSAPSETVELAATPAPTQPPLADLGVVITDPENDAYYWNESMSSLRKLTTSEDVDRAILSPDGKQVALVKTTDYYVYSLDVIATDGSGLRALVTPAAFDSLPRAEGAIASAPYQIIWLSNSQELIFTTYSMFEGPGLVVAENIYRLNTTTGELSVLITLPDQYRIMFFISPDESKVAVSYPEGINLYGIDGTLIRSAVITYPFVNTASEYAWVAEPVWSADSSRLIAVVPPQDPWVENPLDSTVWQIAGDGSSARILFTDQMTYQSSIAAVSPDLSKILYLDRIGSPSDNQFALRLANIDGSGMSEYATGSIHDLPSWSADGTYFYFHDLDSGAFIGQPGGSPVALPDFHAVQRVSWVDDTRFIGAAGPEGGWRVMMGSTAWPTVLIYTSDEDSGFLGFSINR